MAISAPGAPSAIFHRTPIPGVRFMTAQGWDFPWRKLSSSLELTLLERGASDWRVGRWTGTRRAGSLSVVNPGRLAVGTQVHAAGDFFGVEVDPPLVEGWRFDDGQHDGGEVVARASALAWLVRGDADVLAIESSFWALLSELQQHGDRPPGEHGTRPAARMRELLHARYGEPLSLADLARAASVSRFHAVRSFRDAYGVTPFEYLTHVRLERAAAELRSGARVVDVATRTGFADQAHLTRWFAKMFRVTPAVFARAHAPATSSPRPSRRGRVAGAKRPSRS